jgi:biopolymer transport protein ExbB/TolQ
MKKLVVAGVMVVVGIIVVFSVSSEISQNDAIKYFGGVSDIYTIQSMMWVIFFVTLGELGLRLVESIKIDKGFSKGYLPEDSHTVLEQSDMGDISKKTNEDASIQGSLANFIKSVVMQFQISNSIEQTQNMLNSQLEMQSSVIDTNYNMIRYLTWLIPTLGFIGTVIGIANALAYAGLPGKATEPTFVAELTTRLAVAFDTTFVALIMSAVLVFLMHIFQGKDEKNLVKVGQYCLDNLINRLYIKK